MLVIYVTYTHDLNSNYYKLLELHYILWIHNKHGKYLGHINHFSRTQFGSQTEENQGLIHHLSKTLLRQGHNFPTLTRTDMSRI